ncbi:hypothetical protein FOA52_010041 [Chlamydomonas sp. UWO 241]|nr:hypothetical protein FOA52_010041 [Chlamydomonas sp. UWO 241]
MSSSLSSSLSLSLSLSSSSSDCGAGASSTSIPAAAAAAATSRSLTLAMARESGGLPKLPLSAAHPLSTSPPLPLMGSGDEPMTTTTDARVSGSEEVAVKQHTAADLNGAPGDPMRMDADAPAAGGSCALRIANEGELEAFGRLEFAARSLSPSLRGVLAETAVTGVVRYKWSLLRPLVEFAMEQVMRDFDTRDPDQVGPSRGAMNNETTVATIERFKSRLSQYANAPWTLQRLCELVLEPRKQYRHLHKVALALEKCLLVTGETPPASAPPPLPSLSSLVGVNSNPATLNQPAAGVGGGVGKPADARFSSRMDADDGASSAFVASMLVTRGGGGGAGGAAAAAGTAAGAPAEGSAGGGGTGGGVGEAGVGGGGGGTGTGGAHSPGGGGSPGGGSPAGGSPSRPQQQQQLQPQHHAPTHQNHGPGQVGHSGAMEHIEEDHWPDNKAGVGGGAAAFIGLVPLALIGHHHGGGSGSPTGGSPPAARVGSPTGAGAHPHLLLHLHGQAQAAAHASSSSGGGGRSAATDGAAAGSAASAPGSATEAGDAGTAEPAAEAAAAAGAAAAAAGAAAAAAAAAGVDDAYGVVAPAAVPPAPAATAATPSYDGAADAMDVEGDEAAAAAAAAAEAGSGGAAPAVAGDAVEGSAVAAALEACAGEPPVDAMQEGTPQGTRLELNPLGRSGIMVTEACMGTMVFGEQCDEAQANQLLSYAAECGVNYIDTAEVYPVPPRKETHGRCSSYVGSWLAGRRREQFVVASKVPGRSTGLNWVPPSRSDPPSGPEACPRLDKKSIIAAAEGELRRLRTDYIDLFQLHWPDRYVPLFGKFQYRPEANWDDVVPFAEQVEAIGELIKAGKVRAWGLSNETSYGVMSFTAASFALGVPPPVTIQNHYSLVQRTFEGDLAETCLNLGVALLPWSPLAGGALTGKYLQGAEPPQGSRFDLFGDRYERFNSPRVKTATAQYVKIASDVGLTPEQLALGFVRSRW